MNDLEMIGNVNRLVAVGGITICPGGWVYEGMGLCGFKRKA